MKYGSLCLLAAIGFTVITATPVWADKGGKGKDKSGNWEHSKPHYNDDEDKIAIYIGGYDRDIIREHIRKDAFKNCPPGLAKKNPPCVPPGLAKQWRRGYPLPDGVKYERIDWGLKAPYGYEYVKVDKDVLLVAEASKKVIDAVTLLSAVGN